MHRMLDVIIMCGGNYTQFKKHKALTEINGEVLVERTIRLLEENGVKNWWISSNDFTFGKYGRLLMHLNTFETNGKEVKGYWVDAYYPYNKPCIYLHGDVYYTEEAIKKILNYNAKENTFIGNEIARNPQHLNWGEPFGWIIVDQDKFRNDIDKTKQLQDEGKLTRGYALSWELYRVSNGYNPNYMLINDNNYLSINDKTIDIDTPEQIEEVEKRIKSNS